jgi:ATP-binding cassette subfamily F protein uup
LNYLTLENISKSYGDKILFEDLNLTIAKGQKIALIAKNGSGKTTLLQLIAGETGIEGENAKLLQAKDITVGYLQQDPAFDASANVLEAALDSENKQIQAIKALEMASLFNDQSKIQQAIEQVDDLKAWDIEARIKEILGKLKIHDLSQQVATLSGGQKKRLALARILIDEPDFLILDEPTNHLDIDMIEWLEVYLSAKSMTLFMVTHDRYFLERVCNEIVELDNGTLYTYRGNYSEYLEKKSARLSNDKVNLDKTKKLYRKELDWIRRQPKARTTKAKSRVDKFEEIKDRAHQKIDDSELSIPLEMKRLGGKILEAHSISKAFGDIKIIEHFSYKFKKGERIGISGINGSGKTTFIRLLTKEIAPDSGKVIIGDTVEFGHYTQDNTGLNEDLRVIDSIREIAEYLPLKKGLKLTAESLLERFLFPRSQQQVYVSQLSGGEKRRLHLLRILMKNPNFLILDEPTNDLDILTLNVLEEFLLEFPGCLILISHDRYFMDKLVDHLFILEGDGQLKDYNGSYSEYKASRKLLPKAEEKIGTPIISHVSEEETARKLNYNEKKEFEKLELEIAALEKEKRSIESKFLDSNITGDEIADLSQRLGEINKSIESKENRWLELSEFK